MKKVLAWLLLLTLALGVFAGCKPKEADVTEPPYQGVGAADAIEYLKGFYTDSGKQTPVDFTRFGIVRVGGVAFDVVWTTDVSEDLVKIVVNEDGTVTIDINEECEADTEYTLTATITDAQGNTSSHSWTYILPEGVDMVEVVKAAYALQPGESLPYESRLIGKIISIDAIWSDDYQNITVTIEVEGAEDMPIKCYRMKANDSTIDQIKDLKVGNIITVCGTLKNYEGTIEFDAGCILEKVEKGDAIDAPTDPGQILKEAYALPQNAALPYQATLTGTVTEIDAPYDPNYGNISVVITVEGYESMPILCYRLKGTDVEKIAINDLITVTGIIKNYKGTIEYDAGCIMLERVSGGGVAQGPSSDPNKIIPDALALGVGEKLPYRATLTGVVYSVDTPYDPNYANVTVTMKVNGVKFQCYRMVGDGIDQIRESDTITVSGIIENYNGKLEFGAKCTLDNWVMGPRTVNYGPLVEETAYRMYVEQTGIGKTLYFNGEYSGSRLSASTKGSEGADVFVERVSGKGVRFYFMNGETKNYIGVEDYTTNEGKVRGRACVTTEPGICWTYNSDLGVYLAEVGAGKHFLGAYGTYENISASWVGYIDGTYGSGGQYVAQFIKASDVPADEPSQGGATGVMVTDPEVGVPYKWGIEQETHGVTLYFVGTMSGYYGATSENINDGVDVYLEAADGGYYVTFNDASGAKKYITIVISESNGKTYRNFTIADAPSQIYTYNEQYNTLVTEVNGDEVYFGTYDIHKTFSVSFMSKISTSFPAHFYTVGEGGEVEPENPTEPEAPKETIPVVTDKLETGDQVVIYAPGYNKALSADKVNATSYYNKGVDISIANGTMSGYGNAEIWTVTVNSNGTYSFANGGQNIGLADQFNSMNLGAQFDEWTLEHVGGSLYLIKNVGRGNYLEWYASKDNWSTYTSANGDLFEMSLYIVGEGLLGEASEEPEITEPEESKPEETEPEVEGETAKVVFYAPELSAALTTVDTAKTYGYLPKTDITITESDNAFTVEGLVETNVFTMIAADETGEIVYLMDCYGRYMYMKDTHNSFNFSTELPASGAEWGAEIVDENTMTFYLYNVEKEKAIGYDTQHSNFGAYADASKQTVLSMILIMDEEPEESEPDVSEPAGDGYNKVTSADQFTTGEYVMIVDTGYAPGVFDNGWLSAVQPTVSGNSVTDTKGAVWTLTVNGDSVVITDSNGVTIAPKGENKNGVIEKDYDWAWSFENGKFIFAGTGGDAYYLASNATTTGDFPGNHRFRAYKMTTVNGQPANYPHAFTLYKLGGEYIEPEVTEPEVTEPEVTEPSGGEAGMITSPEVGVAYKWAIDQKGIGKTLYFIGTMDGYYGATSENVDEAVDVYLEAADGGYYVTFNDANGAKKYINVVVSVSGTKTYRNFTIESNASSVYTWNSEYNTLNTDVEGTICYIGTWGTYDTFSVSSMDKIGTSYPSYFYGVGEGGEPEETEPEVTEPSGGEAGMITSPEVGVAYKWAIDQNNLGKTLYFIGTMDGYYGATSENVDEAVDVYLEAADGGYYVTFNDANGAKKYINVVVSVSGTKTYRNFTIANNASSVYTWNFEYNTLNTDVEGTICYIGTWGTYDTFSVSSMDKIGTSYPSYFYGVGAGVEPEETEPEVTEPEVTEPSGGEAGMITSPEVGVAYKWAIDQNNLGKTLYFIGTMDGYYGATSENVDEAVDVYLEAADGGYYVTFNDANGAKKYINVVVSVSGTKTYRNFTIANNASSVYTWNSEYNTLNTDVEGTICYIGTWGTYDTFSVSSMDKIGTSYPSYFYGVGEGGEPEETEPEVSEPEETEPSTGADSVTYTFSNYGVGEQYTTGETYDLDATTSLYLVGGHMNGQLRLYDDAKGDAQAIFTCAKEITSVVINAGHRAAALNVYASVDGQNWVLISELATQTSYGDLTVEIPAGYKYLRLDAVGAQIRIPYMIFSFKA